MTIQEFYPLILALFTATATGLIGAFALMKKMTLAGDTMSHIALPGLGLAVIWGINPIIGAAAALAIGALIIWKIQERSDLATETSIGVIFAASIAVGALITPSEELLGALFGSGAGVALPTLLVFAALSLAVVGFVLYAKDKLILSLFNADLARTTGINVGILNLSYFLMFALTLVLGLRFLGILLVGALVIVPAATARQLTENLRWFLLLSALISISAVGIGYLISAKYGFAAGPSVVAVASAMFAISLLKKKD